MNKINYSKTISGKILSKHLKTGELIPGNEITIRIDQTLTQDNTGTMAYLQAETLGISKALTEVSVSYIDHNVVGEDFSNVEDHDYLQKMANKLGIYFSKVGNGICHQVHLENFARPGKTLLGSDSHTPTAGGIGSLAFGAGGLDVALAIGGRSYILKTPPIIGIKLTGTLTHMVAAKDIILEVLRRITVKGGRGKILEYFGEGVKSLSVQQRATITNMGTETGATSSIFPSDEQTKDFLQRVGRENEWEEIFSETEEAYEEIIEINLSELKPLLAMPFSPDNVATVESCQGLKVDQVFIGSCTNSSYEDLVTAALMLKDKIIAKETTLTITPGSMSIYYALIKDGYLDILEKAGAKIKESSCVSCLGFDHDPKRKGVSVKTFNRNFHGHFTNKAEPVYIGSVETAVAAALSGEIRSPQELEQIYFPPLPQKLKMSEALIVIPQLETKENTQNRILDYLLPKKELVTILSGEVLIKLGDDISTEAILPTGRYISLRNDITEYAKHTFEDHDSNFFEKALNKSGGFIVAGENYGQGSSREHAALCPSLLGIKAVIAKNFARIHRDNLINFGVVPLTFQNATDYEMIQQGDVLSLEIASYKETYIIKNLTRQEDYPLYSDFSQTSFDILKAGGLLAKIQRDNKLGDACCVKK